MSSNCQSILWGAFTNFVFLAEGPSGSPKYGLGGEPPTVQSLAEIVGSYLS